MTRAEKILKERAKRRSAKRARFLKEGQRSRYARKKQLQRSGTYSVTSPYAHPLVRDENGISTVYDPRKGTP